MARRQTLLLRFLTLVLGVLLSALIGGSFYLARQTDKLLPEQLARLVTQATNGLYRLERGRIRTLPLGRRIDISDVRIVVDSVRLQQLMARDSLPDRLFSIQMKKLLFTGVRWEDLWQRKVFSCKELILEGLTMRLETGRGKLPFRLRMPRSNFRLSGVEIRDMEAGKMNFSLLHHNGNDRISASSQDGLLSGTMLRWQSGELPSFDALTLTLGATALKFPHTQNQYRATGWQLDLKEKVFRMMGFQFRQWLPDSVPGVRHSLHIALLEARGLRKADSGETGLFVLQNLLLFEPHVVAAITRKEGVAPALSAKPLPQVLLQKAGLPLLVEEATILRGAITYEETRAATGRTGVVSFENLAGDIGPVWLSPLPPGSNSKPMRIRLYGQFQHRSLIAIEALFDLEDSLERFSVSGRIARLNAEQIRDLAANLGHMRIQTLRIDSLRFQLWGNRAEIQSELLLAYHNLGVRLLRYDTSQRRLRQQPVLSLLANELLLHPSNPLPDSALRTSNTTYFRPETQPFISALWRTLFEGIQETVITDPKLLQYLREKAATRTERKQERLRRKEDRRRRREGRNKK